MITEAFSRLDAYCSEVNYKGWDVFDGLNSTLFNNSFIYRSPLFRLAWIQFFKRSPVNLRPLTLVPKGYNAKGLALFASGLSSLNRLEEARNLLSLLLPMACKGFQGQSWGYNFPWQARAFYVPIGKPNMVTTVFVANAFLDFYEKTNELEWLKIAQNCCDFILNHLILFEKQDTLCFGYIPEEQTRVHNANMLGAALLARVHSLTANSAYLEKSQKAMAYSVSALTDKGFWPYGELSHHKFIDNFHTGFNLVALKNWMEYCNDHALEDKLITAYKTFLENFWLEDGCPKYFHDSLYPIDIHCSAQGIITCLSLAKYSSNSLPMAENIANWVISNMQDKKGFFYYQRKKWYTNKIIYIRWSQAWMFHALSFYLSKMTH